MTKVVVQAVPVALVLGIAGAVSIALRHPFLEHDADKWNPVFRKHHAITIT